MPKNNSWQLRLEQVIPGGAHTYSRGVDQFPANAPSILRKGRGAYVWTPEGEKYLDLGMALRSNILGYANKKVDNEVKRHLNLGNNLSKPSLIELEAAERLVSLIPGMDMIKFAKHGSNVTTAACRIARSYTEKKFICVPRQQPFFAFEDWFIGKTPVNKGIPEEHSINTLFFDFNDLASLKELFNAHQNQIAAVMMEPATHLLPSTCSCLLIFDIGVPKLCAKCQKSNFLLDVRRLCDDENSLLILDEMRTGFRWNLRGVQNMYGVIPDLSTFGKALANGYSVSALMGSREVMSVASTNIPGKSRTFVLSSTHGAEMGPLAAANKTVQILEEREVSEYLWRISAKLLLRLRELVENNSLGSFISMEGTPLSLELYCRDSIGEISPGFKTLLLQEMTKHKILVSNGNSISLSLSHGENELDKLFVAFEESLKVYEKALNSTLEKFLIGEHMKPVFRKYN